MNYQIDLLALAKPRLRLSALMALLGLGEHAKKSARCPFHDDSSASFSLFVGEDGEEHWKCFAGCGHGDAIDFLAKVRGSSNPDACREFIKLAGVTLAPSPLSGPNSTTSTQPPFDWQRCVIALSADPRQKLADWRGYTVEFVVWLSARNLIGLFDGERIAFAVHDSQGEVIGCHFRLKEDGTWRYAPTGTRAAPLTIGDVGMAKATGTRSVRETAAIMLAITGGSASSGNGAASDSSGSSGNVMDGFGTPCGGAHWRSGMESQATGCAAAMARWISSAVAPAFVQSFGSLCGDGVTTWTHLQPQCAATAESHRSPGRTPVLGFGLSFCPNAHTTASGAHSPASNLPFSEPRVMTAAVSAGMERCQPSLSATAQKSHCDSKARIVLPAVCALGVVSAAIGAGLEVSSGPNRVTRANLYFLASAESGSGKSETFRLIAAPLVDHQTRLLETWRLKTSPQLQSEIRVLDKEIAALERKAAKSGDPMERERLRGELEFKLASKDEITARAAMPCVIAQDVTTERLAVLLRDNRERVFSASADARKLVDNLLGRYSPGNTTDESLYLSGYSGDFLRVDRQGRDSVVLNKPCLSLCWFIQPDLLAMMLGEQSLSASGFLPRLLICDTRATPRKIESEPQILSESVRDQWIQLVANLMATFHAADKSHRIVPTPAALAVLNDYHNCIVERRAEDLADVGAFAARYAENAWRLAVVLHAAQWASEAGHQALAAETAAHAVRVVEWFVVSQLNILAKGRHAAAAEMEDEVLQLIKSSRARKSQDFVTARAVNRARIVATAEAAKRLLARMETDGLLFGEDITPAHGGKTVRIFRCVQNPVPE